MTKKLLIAAGDSWTDETEECYHNAGMTEVWPNHVANFFDWDLINIGKGGASNDFIMGKAIDAITQNKDRDLVVMVGWTQSQRFVPYELPVGQLTHTFMMPELVPPFGVYKTKAQEAVRNLAMCHVGVHPEGQVPLMSRKEFWQLVGNISLRSIFILDNFCKTQNIPIIHGRALHTLGGIEWILKPEINFERRTQVIEACKETTYYDYIMNMENTVGDSNWFKEKSAWFDVYARYHISINEKHPNDKGMHLISHSFVNKYLELFGDGSESEPAYVYD